MSGGIKNFKGRNGINTFADRKGDINRKGQPRKGVSAVNDELKALGYSPATKNDVEACYMSLIQLEQAQLTDIANNKDKPIIARILAKNMLGGKGFDIIEKMLDRGIGKATQKIDGEVKGEYIIKFEI